MGQKVNPHGLRVGVIKNWDSTPSPFFFSISIVERFDYCNDLLIDVLV